MIWHPFTQHHIESSPLPVASAAGVWLTLEDGRQLIDAVSSWWVNIHGHCHPHIVSAVAAQAQELEQVIFAGFTHQPAKRLAASLLEVAPGPMSHVFFSDDGSTAVEVALKMAIQYWHNIGQPRIKVLALGGAYHGDTFGAMAVGAKSSFHSPFDHLLFEVTSITPPIIGTPNWQELWEEELERLRKELELRGNAYAAIIYEPLIQGAGGMRFIDPSGLDQILSLCKENDIFCIADEVMTGFGRTGQLFASHHLSNKPDLVCLSKGLTGGFMPMGLTLCRQEIFDAFLSPDRRTMFTHGHSFTGNAIACAAANASLEILLRPDTANSIAFITTEHQAFVSNLTSSGLGHNPRSLGTVFAVEIPVQEGSSYYSSVRDHAYHWFLDKGILLRPLGNTLYIMPPYCINAEELHHIYHAVEEYLKSTFLA